ncbi:hypothetical protein J6590_040964 [Homalodisca vitripennis]|nr:hypothetical protein J6590_040964 [Homalodisca vitripennis]
MIAFSNIQSASESVRIMSVDNREMCGEAPQQVSNSQAPSRAGESVRTCPVDKREMCGEAPPTGVRLISSLTVRMIAFSNIQSASEVGTNNVSRQTRNVR